MSNTYTWSYVSADTRSVPNVPVTAGSQTLQTVLDAINAVTFTCTADDGAGHTGSFTDHIVLGDPVTVDTALTSASTHDDILAAAKHAIGLGGIDRWQQQADAALSNPPQQEKQ